MNDKSALLVVDIQNDFFSGGAFEIPNAFHIIPKINRIKSQFDIIIYSKDWHPINHESFKTNGGTWPIHCVQYTDGAKLHLGLIIDDSKDYILHKRTNKKLDSYSAFYDSKEDDTKTILDKILDENNIKHLYICGLVLEYTIFSTLLDAIKFRYKAYLINDATISLHEDKINKCLTHLKRFGVKIVNTSDLY